MKPKRQALNVTIEQLEKLIEELKKDGEQFNGYELSNITIPTIMGGTIGILGAWTTNDNSWIRKFFSIGVFISLIMFFKFVIDSHMNTETKQ